MKRRLSRLLAAVFLSLCAILLAGMISAGYLLHSEDGSRWLLQRVAGLVPGELLIGSQQGRLTGPLKLQTLSYRQDDLHVELGQLRLDWRPSALLQGQLHILELGLEGCRLKLPESRQPDEPQAPAQFEGFGMPLSLAVDALSLADCELTPAGQAEPLRLESLTLQAVAMGEEISIARLQARAFSSSLDLSGKLQLRRYLPLDLSLEWRSQLPDGPSLAGRGTLRGDLQRLHLQQQLDAPLSGNLKADLRDLLATPGWSAELGLEEADLAAFTTAFPARLSGSLSSKGSPDKAALTGSLMLSEPSLGELAAELGVRFEDGQLRVDRLTISNSQGLRLQGTGQYALADEQGELSADLQWSALRWPLVGDAVAFRSKTGKLHLSGRAEAYSYRLEMAGRAPALPAANLTARGTGTLERLAIDSLLLQLTQGSIQGQGDLAWKPELSWQAKLQGQGIDPALFQADLPGNLAFALNSKGRIHAGRPEIGFDLSRLNGEFLGYPLKGSAQARLDDKTLQISSVELFSAANKLQAKGRIGETLALDWSIDAPQMQALWPGLAGNLQARGGLSGATATPRLQLQASGGDLTYGEHRVGSLQAEADLNLQPGQKMVLELTAQQLATAGMTWESLELAGSGVQQDHRLRLELKGKQVPQLALALSAALDQARKTWSGSLQQLSLELPEFGQWRLADPTAFRLGESAQELQNLCLTSEDAAVCGGFSGAKGQGWRSNLQARDLALARFQPRLPPELQLTGFVTAEADLTADAKGRIRGRAELRLPEAELAFELGDEPQQLSFAGTELQAQLLERGGEARLNLPLSGLGAMEGELQLAGLDLASLDLQRQPLAGRLHGQISDLALVSVIVPALQAVRGELVADFSLDGTLKDPRVRGSAALQGGALDIPAAGLQLRELGLQLQAPNLDRLTLSGSVKSGKGSLGISGETRLQAEQGFPTRLAIKGENWVAMDIPEAELRISPDITLDYSPEMTKLKGEILVPYARIRPREIPKGAVSSSPDLVVTGADQTRKQPVDPKLHAELRLILGERVSFDGFGLRASLDGNLLVIDEPGRPVIGRGRLGVTKGTYRAYGQDLKIERGYAQYADSPIDNPGLDVRAVREVEEVTAGVSVSGTLKKPELKVFSIPAMTETEALSYLLTGRAPGQSSGQNLSLAAALKASGAGSVTSELGRQLGLEELRLETGSTLAEASVVAGTYLSPRMYVQYVNELATRETVLRLRYDLSRRLQLQTETGAAQAVDIFYTIER